MLQTLTALLLLVGLGGVSLGVVWLLIGLRAKDSIWKRACRPLIGGLFLTAAGLLAPGAAPPEAPERPQVQAAEATFVDGIAPKPMLATHARRAYALNGTGAVSLWGEPIPDPLAAQGVVSRVTVGREHLCVLRPTGRIECWGEQHEGQASPPAGTYTEIAAGTEHTCALDTDGETWCWGRRDGRLMAPEGVRLRQIASSDQHTCGIDMQGAVHCWGCPSAWAQACQPPKGTFREVSAGHRHSCGILADGTTRCWGSNDHGQSSPPQVRLTTLAAGWTQTCGLTASGEIQCWGCSGRLQRLDPTQASHCSAPAGQFSALSAGDIWGSCALRAKDGSAVCWGGSARTEEPR